MKIWDPISQKEVWVRASEHRRHECGSKAASQEGRGSRACFPEEGSLQLAFWTYVSAGDIQFGSRPVFPRGLEDICTLVRVFISLENTESVFVPVFRILSVISD